MTNFTAAAGVGIPAIGDADWASTLIVALNRIAEFPGIAGLCVRPAETPSTSLGVRVASGYFRTSGGNPGFYPGTTIGLPANSVILFWINDAGNLGTGTDWPSDPSLRLAKATTGDATVAVEDLRIPWGVTLASADPKLSTSGGTVTGSFIVQATPAAATFIVDPVASAIGFFGVTPATRAAAIATPIDQTTGVAATALVDVGATPDQSKINANFATTQGAIGSILAALRKYGLISS